MISLDCETTGMDFRHGSQPFFVTTCDDQGNQHYWEWDVDPLTRRVKVPPGDLGEIGYLIGSADELVMQNGKFDFTALGALGLWASWDVDEAWTRVRELLFAAHLLASNRPKDLTSLAIQYLGVNISRYEDALEQACKKARTWCRTHRKDWRIAKDGLPDMPSAKGGGKGDMDRTWKNDTWLPRAVALAEGYPDDHPWYTVLRDYANADSEVTTALWPVMRDEIHRRKLWTIYEERLKLLPVAYALESKGVTLSADRLRIKRAEYAADAERSARVCVNIAASYRVDGEPYQLDLGKGTNNSLRTFCFDVMGLPPVRGKKSKTDAPSLDKEVMGGYLVTLPPRSKQLTFVSNLLDRRSRMTAVSFMDAYERFWVPLIGERNAETSIESDTGRIESVTEVSDEGEQDADVLGMGGIKVSQRVRAIPQVRGVEGSQSELHSLQGSDSKGDAGSTPMRQSRVRESITPVLRNSPRQYEGHGGEGKGRQSKGRETSSVYGDGRRRTGDAEDVQAIERQTRNTGEIVSNIQSQQVSRLRHSTQEVLETSVERYYRLHPSLNPCGTDTLRWSCNNPNSQNISKKESFNLRYCFGPAPGREWWSLDGKNLELRLPAYEAGEQVMIDLFEKPDEPPYYGSNHLLNFHTVYPDIWDKELREVGPDKVGPHCKKKYASTWYQWCKNGGFAVQYGAVDKADGTGTADRAFHMPGAHSKLRQRFTRIEALNRRCIAQANRLGYVETMPDKTVDPTRGYPLLCTRTERGNVLETVPLSYHIQGTAMWWTNKGMVRCYNTLREWNRKGFDGFITLQVHDEMVFDFPKRAHPLQDPKRSNLGRIKVMQSLMEQSGDDIGVPTPVGLEYHEHSWDVGVTV